MSILDVWDKVTESKVGAYKALEGFFAQYRGMTERQWSIHGEKWSTDDEGTLTDLTEEALFLRRRQWELMATPLIATLLDDAEANVQFLSEDWQRENLKLMRRDHTLMRAIESPDSFDEREKLSAAGAQAFNKTFKIRSYTKCWEAQWPLIEASFIAQWRSMKEPAARLGLSVSDFALQRWMPSMTGAQIEQDLAMAQQRYPAIVKAAAKHAKTMEAPLPLNFKPVPDPEEDPKAFAKAHARYKAFVSDFMGQMLRGAGWTNEELKRHGVKISVKLVPSGGFVMGSPKDIRVGIGLLDEPNPLFMIKQTLAHEFGHVLNLLEGNRLPGNACTQLAGAFNGFGVHEVAAMTMEESFYDMRALRLASRLIEKHFGLKGPAWSAENLYNTLNRPDLSVLKDGMDKLAIVPGMAWRTRAEKWILDSENEKQIGQRVAALPRIYAEEMQKMTGIKHDPAKFIVEEDHWLTDFNMYFYSYIYGAKGAGALMEKMDNDPALQDRLSHARTIGEYVGERYDVLRGDVTMHASMKTPEKIFDDALGKGKFSMDALLSRLERQYGITPPTHKHAPTPHPI